MAHINNKCGSTCIKKINNTIAQAMLGKKNIKIIAIVDIYRHVHQDQHDLSLIILMARMMA
jgi:hypothetical protein